MLNFCVVTSHEEIVPSEITFLEDQLKAERVDVLGSRAVQFQVDSETTSDKILLETGKKIDINFGERGFLYIVYISTK